MVLLVFSNFCYGGQNVVDLKAKADELYKSRKKEEAKHLYVEAASKGNAFANFDLAYKYSIDKKDNYRISALAGHDRGLKYYIEEVFSRAGTFENADPTSALDVYKLAKKANPNIRLFQEGKTLDTLKKCVEAGNLNFSSFSEKYGANIKDPAWRWAKVVSEKESNPRLTLQLVCRGGVIPSELQYAVRDFYRAWKENKPIKFNGCDYAQGKLTIGMCGKGDPY